MVEVWSDIAWQDYRKLFNKHQQKLIKGTHDLITDIERNGVDKGKGRPEPLKHELSGYWSRMIDTVNRLVYKPVLMSLFQKVLSAGKITADIKLIFNETMGIFHIALIRLSSERSSKLSTIVSVQQN